MPGRAAQPDSPAIDEIEITPEMIRAGVKAYWETDPRFGGAADTVAEIYRAMEAAKVASRG